jgi:hypothetical protein
MKKTLLFLFLVSSTSSLWGQHHDHHAQNVKLLENIEPQPLIANAIRVGEALSFIGSSLPPEYLENLNSIQEMPFTKESVRRVQEILDPFCLASIEINPES